MRALVNVQNDSDALLALGTNILIRISIEASKEVLKKNMWQYHAWSNLGKIQQASE